MKWKNFQNCISSISSWRTVDSTSETFLCFKKPSIDENYLMMSDDEIFVIIIILFY